MKSSLPCLCAALGAAVLALATPAPLAAGDGRFRPQFHFTPQRNWLNDPNGLVYYAGEYHLFFQYNPHGIDSANKSWGHAVSRDLLRWEELPVAIPTADGIEIYSGSAVIDWNNTSGFQTGAEPPMIAIYTGAHGTQDQRIAYSNDRGRTFTNYALNPVIDIHSADFRDPKVFWHAPTSRWIMVTVLSPLHKVRFYGSPDLKRWTQLSEFGPAGATTGAWECPDLFQVPVTDGGGAQKWVLSTGVSGGAPAGGSGIQYFVGSFDGTAFTDDNASVARPLPADGIVLNDFESAAYGAWTATGAAFGSGPASGSLANQQTVSGYRGSRLVNTYLGGDDTMGTLTSPAFTISKAYLDFLIGGGSHAGKTCMNLIVNGQTVRTAAGDDSETLNWKNWSVSEFIGSSATIQIVDAAAGGWGHISVDEILQSDSAIAPENHLTLWTETGPDDYAAVSWSDIPAADGRRLWLGWMTDFRYTTAIPTSPWLGGMTFPRELSLQPTPVGLRLAQKPVAEIASLHGAHLSRGTAAIADLNAYLAGQTIPTLFDCSVELEAPAGASAGLKIGTAAEYTLVTWDRVNSRLTVDRSHSGVTNFSKAFSAPYSAPVYATGNRLKLRLLLDSASLEIFAADGSTTLTSLIFPTAGTTGLTFFGPAGTQAVSFDLWTMETARRGTGAPLPGH